MPIFSNKDSKILFIHIPKTGGTTVERVLNKYFEMSFHTIGKPASIKVTPQHFQAHDIKLLFNGIDWDYSFSIVRDPYERLISEYFYQTKIAKENFQSRPDFSMWVVNNLERYKKNNFIFDNHLRPQYQFIDDDIEVFKLENGLDVVLNKLLNKYGFNTLDREKIYYENKTHRDKDVDFSLEAIEIVNEVYHRDFELFGYKKKNKILQVNL